MRLEEEVPEAPAAAEVPSAAVAEVSPQVEVPAAAAPELAARQRHDIDTWLPIDGWKMLRRRGTHPHFPW